MAMSDYCPCAVCRSKAYYDANLSFDDDNQSPTTGFCIPDMAGDSVAICSRCIATHEIVVSPINALQGLSPDGVRGLVEALKEAGDVIEAYHKNTGVDLGEASRMPFYADTMKKIDAALTKIKGDEQDVVQ